MAYTISVESGPKGRNTPLALYLATFVSSAWLTGIMIHLSNS